MESKFMINKCLSREHQELAGLLSSFRNFLRMHGIKQQPDWKSLQSTRLVCDLYSAFDSALPRHFEVEENELFPLLKESGLGQLVDILLEDHQLIVTMISTIKPLLQKAKVAGDLTEEEWQLLYREGDAIVTELSAHAEKEDAGLVPELEELLDEKQADAIYQRYRSLCT